MAYGCRSSATLDASGIQAIKAATCSVANIHRRHGVTAAASLG
jgi:hypothetical protein